MICISTGEKSRNLPNQNLEEREWKGKTNLQVNVSYILNVTMWVKAVTLTVLNVSNKAINMRNNGTQKERRSPKCAHL